jgi:hypothetical protein
LLNDLTSKSVGRLDVEAAAYLGDVQLVPALQALRRWWDVDTDLLETAIARSDPKMRRAHENARERSLARFRRRLIAAMSEVKPGISIRTVDLPEDPNDYFLRNTLEISWKSTGGANVASWYWPSLMDRASGRVEAAARLAAEDILARVRGTSAGADTEKPHSRMPER